MYQKRFTRHHHSSSPFSLFDFYFSHRFPCHAFIFSKKKVWGINSVAKFPYLCFFYIYNSFLSTTVTDGSLFAVPYSVYCAFGVCWSEKSEMIIFLDQYIYKTSKSNNIFVSVVLYMHHFFL